MGDSKYSKRAQPPYPGLAGWSLPMPSILTAASVNVLPRLVHLQHVLEWTHERSKRPFPEERSLQARARAVGPLSRSHGPRDGDHSILQLMTPVPKRRWFRFGLWVAIASVAFLSGCGPSSPSERALGGKSVLQIIQHPDSVQASRLRPPSDTELEKQANADRIQVEDFEIVGDAIEVPAAIAERIGSILASPESYSWDPKGCVPIYGVRLSFHWEDSRVDILLCLECDILMVFQDGFMRETSNFDPAHDLLVAELKSLFPDDKEIQGLPIQSSAR